MSAWRAGTGAPRRSRSSTRRAASARRPSRPTSPSALQMRKGKSVLLIDADTVTGHVTTSLGIDAVRTVADSWRDEAEGGPSEDLLTHRLAALVRDEGRRPDRFAAQHRRPRPDPAGRRDRRRARSWVDVIVARPPPVVQHAQPGDLRRGGPDPRAGHPGRAGDPRRRPAARRAVGLGCRERLAMVINRANSGVSVEDMERTVGMPALAQIRSGGLLFVRAANEGRTVIEMFPREKITADFDVLADRVLGTPVPAPAPKAGFRLRLAARSRRAPDAQRASRRISASARADRSSSTRPAARPAAAGGARPSGRRPARPRAGTGG